MGGVCLQHFGKRGGRRQLFSRGRGNFLGVISAGANIPKVVLIVAIVCAGFSIGYTIDYLLGKYGWYKLLTKFGMGQQIETAKARLEKHSFKAIAASYWEVNLASITATAAGILKIDFKRFFGIHNRADYLEHYMGDIGGFFGQKR